MAIQALCSLVGPQQQFKGLVISSRTSQLLSEVQDTMLGATIIGGVIKFPGGVVQYPGTGAI